MPSWVGRYECKGTLGSGFGGKVRLGFAEGKEFAIKILEKAKIEADPLSLKNFLSEVEAYQRLSHPHILQWSEYQFDAVWLKSRGR
jgi:hypothetical protein